MPITNFVNFFQVELVYSILRIEYFYMPFSLVMHVLCVSWRKLRVDTKMGIGDWPKSGPDTMVGTATFVTDKGVFGVGHCP